MPSTHTYSRTLSSLAVCKSIFSTRFASVLFVYNVQRPYIFLLLLSFFLFVRLLSWAELLLLLTAVVSFFVIKTVRHFIGNFFFLPSNTQSTRESSQHNNALSWTAEFFPLLYCLVLPYSQLLLPFYCWCLVDYSHSHIIVSIVRAWYFVHLCCFCRTLGKEARCCWFVFFSSLLSFLCCSFVRSFIRSIPSFFLFLCFFLCLCCRLPLCSRFARCAFIIRYHFCLLLRWLALYWSESNGMIWAAIYFIYLCFDWVFFRLGFECRFEAARLFQSNAANRFITCVCTYVWKTPKTVCFHQNNFVISFWHFPFRLRYSQMLSYRVLCAA